jgi:hypothetical protein
MSEIEMLMIIIFCVIVLIIVIFTIITKKRIFWSSSNVATHVPTDQIHIENEKPFVNNIPVHPNSEKNEFDLIVQSIDKNFSPIVEKDEEDCENQLINYLNSRFPNNVQKRGHTTEGRRIDIVIDGTYALELIIVSNEGKLVSLMDQVLKSKKEFSEVAVILLDIGKVTSDRIEEYINDFKAEGVKTIIKKC